MRSMMRRSPLSISGDDPNHRKTRMQARAQHSGKPGDCAQVFWCFLKFSGFEVKDWRTMEFQFHSCSVTLPSASRHMHDKDFPIAQKPRSTEPNHRDWERPRDRTRYLIIIAFARPESEESDPSHFGFLGKLQRAF